MINLSENSLNIIFNKLRIMSMRLSVQKIVPRIHNIHNRYGKQSFKHLPLKCTLDDISIANQFWRTQKHHLVDRLCLIHGKGYRVT